VNDIEVKDDRAVLRTGTGDEVEARVAVIAGGFGSGLTGTGKTGDFAMGAQAEVETNGIEKVEVYSGRKIAPGFFAWLVPTGPGRALAGLITRRRTAYYMKQLLSSLAEKGKITMKEPEISYAGLALRANPRTSGNRILVVGSAAGQVKPTTGGGIYYGLMCADIAADCLHRALESDNLSSRNLSEYDRKWKKALGHEQRLGYWGRKFFELLSDRQIDKIFDIIINNGIDEALLQSEEVNFDWHGKTILKLLGHSALSKIAGAVRLPFPAGKKSP
jgi:flavin-dependent dehydrogenase